MRGAVTVRAGQYRLEEGVRLVVHAADAGTVVVLEDSPTGRRYTAIIDEHGTLVWPRSKDHAAFSSVTPPGGENVAPSQLASSAVDDTPPPLHPGARSSRKTNRRSMNIPFTIKCGRRVREQKTALVMGGYMDGGRIYVLYRTSSGADGIMLLIGKRVFIADAVPPDDRLPDSRWDFFLSLPAHAMIKLKHLWRKMSEDELTILIGERKFRVTAPRKPM